MNKKQFFAIMMVVFGIIFIGIAIMKYAPGGTNSDSGKGSCGKVFKAFRYAGLAYSRTKNAISLELAP